MPHEIKHTFICDFCGHQYPAPLSTKRTQLIHHPHNTVIEWTLPCGWNFLQGKYVCPAHAITVTHNGDSITVKEASE